MNFIGFNNVGINQNLALKKLKTMFISKNMLMNLFYNKNCLKSFIRRSKIISKINVKIIIQILKSC